MVAASISKTLSITLRVWRQSGPTAPGGLVDYPAKNLSSDMSFLEMLDVVNDELTIKGEEPIAFDQRKAPWPGSGNRDLPALHAEFP
jgi:succinate dehydrogenase / fumarate reductase iron-sulfur subunit